MAEITEKPILISEEKLLKEDTKSKDVIFKEVLGFFPEQNKIFKTFDFEKQKNIIFDKPKNFKQQKRDQIDGKTEKKESNFFTQLRDVINLFDISIWPKDSSAIEYIIDNLQPNNKMPKPDKSFILPKEIFLKILEVMKIDEKTVLKDYLPTLQSCLEMQLAIEKGEKTLQRLKKE